MYDMEVKEGGAAVVDAYANATEGDDKSDNPQDDESHRDSGVDDRDSVVADTENMIEKDWDPFKGVEAPVGYSYDGKLAFLCLGPTTQHFSKVIRLGGSKASKEATPIFLCAPGNRFCVVEELLH